MCVCVCVCVCVQPWTPQAKYNLPLTRVQTLKGEAFVAFVLFLAHQANGCLSFPECEGVFAEGVFAEGCVCGGCVCGGCVCGGCDSYL